MTASTRHPLTHLVSHLLTPLLMCLGMALAYQGAFHQPAPHHLKVAVVGSSPQSQALAAGIQQKAGSALDISTVPDRAAGAHQIEQRQLVGAFVPDPRNPELLVATANSDSSKTAVQEVFTQVADAQGVPMKTTDLVPTSSGDPTGQGIFFLLVALSVGAYGSVAVIGAAGAALSMRGRALVGLAVSLAVSVIGIVVAGPVYHIVDHHQVAVWALAWLYSAGIVMIGTGLHSFLKRWTTLTLMVLFVMLNFTSSGGVFQPALQPGLFGWLHRFYDGAGFVEGTRSILYFDGGVGLGGRVLSLALWLVAGLALVAAGGWYERRARLAAQRAAARPALAVVDGAEEEMEEAVGV
ncbi:hypothetical protein E6W39_33090 [Kitasatospora acidiphila]|uniref:ABC transporter permease n=1 Tax=Kitasatospora acidiphila TaxID=2567942 RepID=A0A540WAZ8_9ACTN|nr:hypothetical protein [Kitasatospora acidiphila]TQF06176.1 hypothetical protein E6W39_33090 [Kitasatospora acidiphila]